jgi:hypothetical protein
VDSLHKGDTDDDDDDDGNNNNNNNNNIKCMVLIHCHIVCNLFRKALAFLSATILIAAGFVFKKCAQ